jgi:hypothetical protein
MGCGMKDAFAAWRVAVVVREMVVAMSCDMMCI